ncbi:MAG: hypothetical protein MMC23_000879 [Stictis urceolatum]|nr:hypothetical protein [Stictis urceolata]
MDPWVVAGQPLYGDEPDKFVPEWWLCGKEESEAACTERTNAWKRADIVSSHGKYSSSGKNVAIWEMYKVLPTLLLNFDVELQDQDKSGNVIDRFIRILPLISVFAAYAEEPFTRYDRVISRLMLQCSPQSMTASSRIRQTELYDGEHKRTRRELVDSVLLWSYLNHMDDHAKL